LPQVTEQDIPDSFYLSIYLTIYVSTYMSIYFGGTGI
jgi:hypothetical protein